MSPATAPWVPDASIGALFLAGVVPGFLIALAFAIFSWLQARAHLVTDEQHAHAWKVAHVNNGFRKPAG